VKDEKFLQFCIRTGIGLFSIMV